MRATVVIALAASLLSAACSRSEQAQVKQDTQAAADKLAAETKELGRSDEAQKAKAEVKEAAADAGAMAKQAAGEAKMALKGAAAEAKQEIHEATAPDKGAPAER